MSNPHWYQNYYVQMWARIPPYLFGIILGWILHRTKNAHLKLNKVRDMFLFIIFYIVIMYFESFFYIVGCDGRLDARHCDWIVDCLRIDALPGRRDRSRDERFRPSLFRLFQSIGLVRRRRMGHLCLRQRLRRFITYLLLDLFSVLCKNSFLQDLSIVCCRGKCLLRWRVSLTSLISSITITFSLTGVVLGSLTITPYGTTSSIIWAFSWSSFFYHSSFRPPSKRRSSIWKNLPSVLPRRRSQKQVIDDIYKPL